MKREALWHNYYLKPRSPNRRRKGLTKRPTRMNVERGDTPGRNNITTATAQNQTFQFNNSGRTTPRGQNNTATNGSMWTAKPLKQMKDLIDYDIPYCSCFSGWEGPKCDKKSPTLPPLPPYTGEGK